MMTIETIAVGNMDSYIVLERLVERERMEYSTVVDESDPTPYNLVVRGHDSRIQRVLEGLDSKGIWYETTMDLPVL